MSCKIVSVNNKTTVPFEITGPELHVFAVIESGHEQFLTELFLTFTKMYSYIHLLIFITLPVTILCLLSSNIDIKFVYLQIHCLHFA